MGNFISMLGQRAGSCEPFLPNPVLERALDLLFILHADHEQNCSTNAMRSVGSSHADPFCSMAAATAALYGPLHGGANEEVLKMLREIQSKDRVPEYIKRVKSGEMRLMGFGHRVYKNYDPRARIIRQAADEVFEVTGSNPLLDIALELERIALVGRVLHQAQAVSQRGLLLRDHLPGDGLSGRTMFTVLFAIAADGRLARAVAGDAAGQGAEDRAATAGLRGPGGTGLRAHREEECRVKRVIVIGAAGRDFFNFLTVYRDDPDVEVVAFTAQQIPHIAERGFPASLAGPRYPKGIPIHPEHRLEELVRTLQAEQCVLSYSDLADVDVMHLAARVNAAGADFVLLGAQRVLRSTKPVVAICASRTGAGKSPLSRAVVPWLREHGQRVAVIRHPMPYGDLAAQRVQRFASEADLVAHKVTVEEREEYEPHIAAGSVVFAGVDYARDPAPRPSRKPTSSCGTAATTTRRSSRPTSTSPSWTRTAPGTS